MSNELGAGRPSAARFAAVVSCLLALLLVALTALAVLLGRDVWLHLFTSARETDAVARPVLAVCAGYAAR